MASVEAVSEPEAQAGGQGEVVAHFDRRAGEPYVVDPDLLGAERESDGGGRLPGETGEGLRGEGGVAQSDRSADAHAVGAHAGGTGTDAEMVADLAGCDAGEAVIDGERRELGLATGHGVTHMADLDPDFVGLDIVGLELPAEAGGGVGLVGLGEIADLDPGDERLRGDRDDAREEQRNQVFFNTVGLVLVAPVETGRGPE